MSVAEFIEETREDYSSPTTSRFNQKMTECRNTISSIEEVCITIDSHHDHYYYLHLNKHYTPSSPFSVMISSSSDMEIIILFVDSHEKDLCHPHLFLLPSLMWRWDVVMLFHQHLSSSLNMSITIKRICNNYDDAGCTKKSCGVRWWWWLSLSFAYFFDMMRVHHNSYLS